MMAVRGLGDDFPLSLSLCSEDERQFLAVGLEPIEIHEAQVLPFFQVYDASFVRRKLQLFVPLIVRDEIVGALFLGEKATSEVYTKYEKEIICAMGRHIGVAIAQRNLMAEIERHVRNMATTITLGRRLSRRHGCLTCTQSARSKWTSA